MPISTGGPRPNKTAIYCLFEHATHERPSNSIKKATPQGGSLFGVAAGLYAPIPGKLSPLRMPEQSRSRVRASRSI